MCENLAKTVKSNVDQTIVLSNTNGYIYVQLRNRSRHFRLEKTWRETWCLGVQWLLCQKKKHTADAQSKNEWSVYICTTVYATVWELLSDICFCLLSTAHVFVMIGFYSWRARRKRKKGKFHFDRNLFIFALSLWLLMNVESNERVREWMSESYGTGRRLINDVLCFRWTKTTRRLWPQPHSGKPTTHIVPAMLQLFSLRWLRNTIWMFSNDWQKKTKFIGDSWLNVCVCYIDWRVWTVVSGAFKWWKSFEFFMFTYIVHGVTYHRVDYRFYARSLSFSLASLDFSTIMWLLLLSL